MLDFFGVLFGVLSLGSSVSLLCWFFSTAPRDRGTTKFKMIRYNEDLKMYEVITTNNNILCCHSKQSWSKCYQEDICGEVSKNVREVISHMKNNGIEEFVP